MKKSNLDVVFTDYSFNKFSKDFKKLYKEENGEAFKGNVLNEITLNVLVRKRFPDTEDLIQLIILGKQYEGDEERKACDFLTRVSQSEEYKERGRLGIFCDLCKDAHIDIGLNSKLVDVIDTLEVDIIDRLNNIGKKQNNFEELKNKFKELKESVEAQKEQETAEADTVE